MRTRMVMLTGAGLVVVAAAVTAALLLTSGGGGAGVGAGVSIWPPPSFAGFSLVPPSSPPGSEPRR